MGDLSRVNTNVAALRAFLTLNTINSDILRFQRQISTGKVINQASDSPSGYFAAKAMTRDIQIKDKAILQIERGVNFLQNNSTKLNTIADILIEIVGIASAANSGAVSSAERSAMQADINGLIAEVNALLQSGISSNLYLGFSVGGLSNVAVSGSGTSAGTRGVTTTATLTINANNLMVTGYVAGTQVLNAQTAITNATNALTSILKENEQVGSYVRRLQFELSDANSTVVDLKASLATLQDADIAEVQLNLTKAQILQQTALAMLAQANTAPQSILVLFGG
ncbi:MAG: flagellin [Candidatus Aureabacteria bacterium]|nr:flagellin [Candidatus Auribacterota bacterium]